MKSIIEEGSTIAKAVERGWQKAGKPKEFSVKIFEEAEKNFIGFTTKSAKVGIFFKPAADTEPGRPTQGSGQRRPQRRPQRSGDGQTQRPERRTERREETREQREPRELREQRDASGAHSEQSTQGPALPREGADGQPRRRRTRRGGRGRRRPGQNQVQANGAGEQQPLATQEPKAEE